MSRSNRLPTPAGLLLRRDKPLDFQFEDKAYQGCAGDTLASALLANGQWLLSRSFKYHRPRGPLTMAAQDANTLVQLGSEPNVLADRRPLVDGMVARGQNYWGSLERDGNALLGYFSRFMPVGFYYRAFYKPMGLWRQWEKAIRRMAGLGVLDVEFKPGYHDKAYLFYDVVVVGAGPAGMAAALQAADNGVSVLLVDEQPLLGGALSYHRFDLDGREADVLREQLTDRVQAHADIDVMLEATCNGWFADNYLPVIQGNRMYKVRARECIVASGAYEQHAVFRNNDLPGIVLCSAASRMMKHYGVRPGKRAVVLTGNDDGYRLALELDDNGVEVVAVVDMRPQEAEPELAQALVQRDIELLVGSTVYEALATRGNRHIRAVDVRVISGRGTVAAGPRHIDCDLLCMTTGYMPAYQLLCQAGAQLSYDDSSAEFALSALPGHLHIAGSVNGIHTLSAVLADGERAAMAALHNLGRSDQLREAVQCDAVVNFDWPIFVHPKGKEFVDYDEDLQALDIVNATRMGYRDVQLVKRFSTVGMGPSQGRHSALPTARLVAQATGRSVTETGVTTARPPFTPETLSHLAGRSFDPYRRSAMHHRHTELGASMIPAGNWQRPGFYGPATDRDRCVHSEAGHVRSKVGLIDISTLGGIEIFGPDAAEFMNRMYTFAFLKQPVGKSRYAVAASEHGVVIDDGVACRFADEHFYVTATTTGVDRIYRDMLKWNAQWRLEVDVTNVTSAFAAVNLAGPDSRRVLQKLVSDLDLGSESFPYLACQQGTVANIPARLLRVGFVGELGFEIHVPTRCGEALWDAVMAAGAEYDIKPFGVEAQRLLRLEKGHIIVGQDTDGMSHPGELSLQWAIAGKKPFYVGGRSVSIVMAQQQTRKLVGFTLPVSAGKPEEGHLVLAGGDISGNVTSCEYSPTLDRYIGLAYVGCEQSMAGAAFPIRVGGGILVEATVAPLPFYDPDNQRQEA